MPLSKNDRTTRWKISQGIKDELRYIIDQIILTYLIKSPPMTVENTFSWVKMDLILETLSAGMHTHTH